MTQKQTKAFGSWPTPITTELTLSSTVSLGDVLTSGESSPSKTIAWVEGRPDQGGRNTIFSLSANNSTGDGGLLGTVKGMKNIKEVTSDKKWNARTQVHEYGGASVSLVGSDKILFSDMATGSVYIVGKKDDSGDDWGEPTSVTPQSSVYRYADFQAEPFSVPSTTKSSSSSDNPRYILSVMEDHTEDHPSTVKNSIVLIDSQTKKVTTIASGNDFYSAPRWCPTSSGNETERWICWIEWRHPLMPWEGSELYIAKLSTSTQALIPGTQEKVAGNTSASKDNGGSFESISQPRWNLDGTALFYLSDKTGFYELYLHSLNESESVAGAEGSQPKSGMVLKKATGSDVGPPDWEFGFSYHQPLTTRKHIAVAKGGNLRVIDIVDQTSTVIETPFASISCVKVVDAEAGTITVIGSSAIEPRRISIGTMNKDYTHIEWETLRISSEAKVEESYISKGNGIKFPTLDGKGEAYAILYEPENKTFIGKENELPPLVVKCHGGPTSSAPRGLDWGVQFYTSRGFAFVDVDYGGSSGYGRAYRERLNKSWGVVDVDDTIACVKYLVQEQLVDSKRVAITGGSAGGFTVLAALCQSNVFKAGTSSYGISDLKLLASDTHKFESQYLFGLLGGTPEEVPEVYHDRSPINKASAIKAPLLILQGDLDKVVPPEQATIMAETIRKAGGQCEIIIMKGEGHGFRKAENKIKAAESELAFYIKSFGIETV